MEPGDIIGEVFHNDREKIETFLNLTNIDDKVESLFNSESMQNVFKCEHQKTTQKSEGNDNPNVVNVYYLYSIVESSRLREEGNILIQVRK